jgi:magnesium chelatase family protein
MQNLTYSPINERRCSRRRSFTRKTDICHKFKEYNFAARIDIQCEITPLSFEELSRTAPGESSATIRERVVRARKIQEERFKDEPGVHCNAQMTSRLMHRYAEPAQEDLDMLREAMNRLQLSARAYDRILRVARTIADLEASERIQTHHLQEAIGYRNLDRSSWGE